MLIFVQYEPFWQEGRTLCIVDLILQAHLCVSRTSSQAAGTDDLAGGFMLIAGRNHLFAVAQWEQFEQASKNRVGPEDANTDHIYLVVPQLPRFTLHYMWNAPLTTATLSTGTLEFKISTKATK